LAGVTRRWPPPPLGADLSASRAMLLAVALLAALWVGLAGLVFGIFTLIHG
jgi:hypothetical protein